MTSIERAAAAELPKLSRWDDYEEAGRLNFSTLRQEIITSCQDCGARLTGSDEKSLKKKRRQHAHLHAKAELYIKGFLGEKGDSVVLSARIEDMRNLMARDLHETFKNYLRFLLDQNDIWPRLRVQQKGNLEWKVKAKWHSLDDREKDGFLNLANEFIETVYPSTGDKLSSAATATTTEGEK